MREIEQFDFGPKPPTSQSGGGDGRRYPWAEWLDGKTREVVRGVDYDITSQEFVIRARRAAWKRGLSLRIRTTPTSVTFKTESRDAA